MLQLFPPSVALLLGFSDRRQTVSEADAEPGLETFSLNIFNTSLRTSEIRYYVNIRSVIEGQPIIEPVDDIQNPMFDGAFGQRVEHTINNLIQSEVLNVNTTMLPALRVIIRDDVYFEEEECFELGIFPVNDFGKRYINFLCNFMAGDDFLCTHEICIVDDDG